ncbi:MAG: type II toxin-antitoxin system HicB family antitoxin [Candidatus Binatus sp.]|uniref:helix-turn-helix domain-containing protein n=1 Tax=Candidatus Binatus sp. TaxID=2811406 RepID=UPI003BAF90AF
MELPVILNAGQDGYIVAECPVIPGCISQGRTRSEALRNVREAIELCLESRAEEGWELASHYDVARIRIANASATARLARPARHVRGVATRKAPTFGQVIRERRRQLDLTKDEVARRLKTSTNYVGHLESGKRHPSDKIVVRLAEVLGLDRRELFFLANPRARALLTPEDLAETEKVLSNADSAWKDFRKKIATALSPRPKPAHP